MSFTRPISISLHLTGCVKDLVATFNELSIEGVIVVNKRNTRSDSLGPHKGSTGIREVKDTES